MCSKPPPASAAERKLWAGKGGFWRWDCLYLVIALLETESFLLSHFSCGARYKVQQESAAVGQRDIRNVNFFNYIFCRFLHTLTSLSFSAFPRLQPFPSLSFLLLERKNGGKHPKSFILGEKSSWKMMS